MRLTSGLCVQLAVPAMNLFSEDPQKPDEDDQEYRCQGRVADDEAAGKKLVDEAPDVEDHRDSDDHEQAHADHEAGETGALGLLGWCFQTYPRDGVTVLL